MLVAVRKQPTDADNLVFVARTLLLKRFKICSHIYILMSVILTSNAGNFEVLFFSLAISRQKSSKKIN